LGGGDNRSHTWTINSGRLFHKNVLAGFYRSGEVDRSESWRCGENDNINIGCQNFLVGIKAGERSTIDFDSVRHFFFETVQTPVQSIWEHITDGVENYAWIGGKAISDGTATSATASN
jgi:hypothetical protein